MARDEAKLGFMHMAVLVPTAVVFDVLSIWIPGVAALGIMMFRVIFFLIGVNTSWTNAGFMGGMLIESAPVLSILPATTAFVVIAYVEGKAEQELGIRAPSMNPLKGAKPPRLKPSQRPARYVAAQRPQGGREKAQFASDKAPIRTDSSSRN